jgi:hypothetical protein
MDYFEEETGIKQSGIIALQVRGGPPMEVQYKDIDIEEFPSK